jgi:hypothetical protein
MFKNFDAKLKIIFNMMFFLKKYLPEAKRQLPEVKRHLPGTKRQLPEAKRQLPGTKRQLPEAKRHLPETKRHLPGTKGQMCSCEIVFQICIKNAYTLNFRITNSEGRGSTFFSERHNKGIYFLKTFT